MQYDLNDLIITGILQGLVLSLVTYAVMIPFRILKLTDVTAEGAYSLAGGVSATTMLMGLNPILALMLSGLIAGGMGVVTGLIHLRLKVNTMLAGIILNVMAYSINLRIMGKPNLSLFNSAAIFDQSSSILNIIIVGAVLLLLLLPFIIFLATDFGLKFRAVGFNHNFAKRQGINIARYTIGGLFVAGCFTGVAGGLIVQLQSYMDIGIGIGIVIHALAALMIGECIVGNSSLNRQLLAPLAGSLIYQQIQGLVLFLGLAPSDLKFLTGAIVLALIAVNANILRLTNLFG